MIVYLFTYQFESRQWAIKIKAADKYKAKRIFFKTRSKNCEIITIEEL